MDSRAPTLPVAIPPQNPNACRWHLEQRKKISSVCEQAPTLEIFFFAESEGFENYERCVYATH